MVVKDWLQLISPFLVLAATWFVGQRILVSWDIRKKRQELDIAAATQFQQLYGEAKEIARLWRLARDEQDPPLPNMADLRWQLLARATAVEGKFEAVAIKLAAERYLSKEEIINVGLFRRSCHELREAIHKNELPGIGFGGGYTLFNKLAVEITSLLNRSRPAKSPSPEVAMQNLMEIAMVGRESLQHAVAEMESEQPLSHYMGR